MAGRTTLRVAAGGLVLVVLLGAYRLGAQQVPRALPPPPEEPPAASSNDLPRIEAQKEAAPVFQPPPPVRLPADQREKIAPRLEEIIAEAKKGLEPNTLPQIPDAAPPHEGAMIDYPYVVEPTDLVQIEVLEALPGRPISGKRLVRSDGTIGLGFYGDLYVKGLTREQIKVKLILHLRQFLIDEILGLLNYDGADDAVVTAPASSDRVFVEIEGRNSKHYFVEGDVSKPGRFEWTGHDTVLDAVRFASGMLATADLKRVRLVRPSPGSKEGRVYPIDWTAIVQRGDTRANLQLFPNDRLYVDRLPAAKAMDEMNRMAEPFTLVWNQILLRNMAVQSIETAARSRASTGPITFSIKTKGGNMSLSLTASQDAPVLTDAQREAVLKEFADFWWNSTHPNGAKLDEKIFRDALSRGFPPRGTAPAAERK